MKRVFTGDELPDLLAVNERRQAYRTFVADFLTNLVLIVLKRHSHITIRRTISGYNGDRSAGEPSGSPAPEAEETWRALDGEEEGVDKGGDGDDGDEAENEFNWREIVSPMCRRVRRRRSIHQGGAGVHLGHGFLSFGSSGTRFEFYYFYS